MLEMSDTGWEARAKLLITGFGPFPGVPENPSGLIIEKIASEGWAPPGAALEAEVVPVQWSGAPETIAHRVRSSGCDGVLMVGVASKARTFRVEMRAQNRVNRRRRDADGAAWIGEKILPIGPAVARATAPVADMVRAIQRAGFPCEASSDAGDYLCNFTLYRVLVDTAADPQPPTAGFLHVPMEVVRDGRLMPLGLSEIEHAVKAAAAAFALRLAPVQPVLASA
jgi:pyroglutamyl-peptidase